MLTNQTLLVLLCVSSCFQQQYLELRVTFEYSVYKTSVKIKKLLYTQVL